MPDFREALENCQPEWYQEIGDSIRVSFQTLQIQSEALRDGLAADLKRHGYNVERSGELIWAIEELRKLKAEMLKDWPWEDRPFPPLNRQLVQESRAAFVRGEGEFVTDMIRRLESCDFRSMTQHLRTT